MNHLTVDEIIEFVSSSNADRETLKLISRVNQHIRTCQKCFETVKAFQVVYDEFVRISDDNDFRSYVCNVLEKDLLEKLSEYEEFDEDIIKEI